MYLGAVYLFNNMNIDNIICLWRRCYTLIIDNNNRNVFLYNSSMNFLINEN